MKRARLRDDNGFSLLEVLTTCLLLSLLLGLAVAPWRSYAAAQAHRDSARELTALLRHAQVSSVSEVVTYRVDISASEAREYRVSAGIATLKQSTKITDSSVAFTSASFVDAAGATSASVYFYPKGSASKGSVDVVRSGTAKTYTVSVEGLTARVSYTD